MEDLEISTPENEIVEDNSTIALPDDTQEVSEDNTADEPETDESSAEIEENTNGLKNEQRLFAGKFKDIDNLEKGYKELESKLGQIRQKESQEKIELAKAQGYNSVEEAEIARQINAKELEFYASKLGTINPEYSENARIALLNYANSGNKEYLDLARQFFNGDVIEECALLKTSIKNEIERSFKQQEIARKEEFISKLENDNKEFLSDIEINKAKLNAFKALFSSGQIQSQQDMDAFIAIYNAIKEEGANSVKSDVQTKSEISSQIEKMQTASDSSAYETSTEKWFTKEEFEAMSNREYEANQEKIDRQMQLELEGKIPKRILS